MPFIYNGVWALEDEPVIGDGSCVTLIKVLTPGLKGLPTSAWRQGKAVVGSNGIVPGTAIATFENGRYPQRNTGNHAAFFLAYGGAGFWVMDQWTHKDRVTIKRRYIYPKPPRKNGTFALPSNSAGAFFVIEIK